jgi:hypothetical protein
LMFLADTMKHKRWWVDRWYCIYCSFQARTSLLGICLQLNGSVCSPVCLRVVSSVCVSLLFVCLSVSMSPSVYLFVYNSGCLCLCVNRLHCVCGYLSATVFV